MLRFMGHKVRWDVVYRPYNPSKVMLVHADACKCSFVQEAHVAPYMNVLIDAQDLWEKQGKHMGLTLEEFIVKLGLAEQL